MENKIILSRRNPIRVPFRDEESHRHHRRMNAMTANACVPQ